VPKADKREQATQHCFLKYAFNGAGWPMAKSSKLEPVNVELYEKAWARFGRGVNA
jgi:hypothetical protein